RRSQRSRPSRQKPAIAGQEVRFELGDDDQLKRLEELEAEVQEDLRRCDQMIETWLREMAGSRLDSMRTTEEESYRCLADPDPTIRQVALHLVVRYWPNREKAAERCEHLATTDSDPDVRESAVQGIGACYAHSRDARISKLLATVALDESEHDKVRLQ